MNADINSSDTNSWALPKFYFQVDFGDGSFIPIGEVAGLEIEAKAIEYRKANSSSFEKPNEPSGKQNSKVTLKKGIVKGDNKLWDWYEMIKAGTIIRKPITIRLMDEAGDLTMVWQLSNAWPAKVTGTDLKSSGNEVAVESIELVYETLSITKP